MKRITLWIKLRNGGEIHVPEAKSWGVNEFILRVSLPNGRDRVWFRADIEYFEFEERDAAN